jgi:hypothetical protein
VIGDRTSLLYQQHATGRQDGEVRTVLRMIGDLESSTESVVARDTPTVFSSIIGYMKSMNADALKEAYARVKADQRQRKIFIDALALVGTGSSVAMMQDLIAGDRIEAEEANNWLTSLAFTSYPTNDMISAVAVRLGS